MVAGLAYSIYYLQADRAIQTRTRTAWIYVSIGLCAVGFLTSFGRGAFLAFIAVCTSMWLRAKRKTVFIIAACGHGCRDTHHAAVCGPLCGHDAEHYAARYGEALVPTERRCGVLPGGNSARVRWSA